MHEVKLKLIMEPEGAPVRGMLVASGDAAADRRDEDAILRRMRHGDTWAWFSACVVASFGPLEGSDSLGCCSYADAEDFLQSDTFEEMKAMAVGELARSLASLQGCAIDEAAACALACQLVVP